VEINRVAGRGFVRCAKASRRNSADLAGTCSGNKLVVSMAAEAYDVRVRGSKLETLDERPGSVAAPLSRAPESRRRQILQRSNK
jgi:hypothetical protein